MCHSVGLASDQAWRSTSLPTHRVKVMKCMCCNPTTTPAAHQPTGQRGRHRASHSGSIVVYCFYGALSVSSASTRQDWSGSRTRNGGWYSNAVKTKEPGFLLWWTNQMKAETPRMTTTLRITRPDTRALGSAGSKQQQQQQEV